MTIEVLLAFAFVFALIAVVKGPGILRDVRATSDAANAAKLRKTSHAGGVIHVFDGFDPATRRFSKIRSEQRTTLISQGYKPSGYVVQASDDGFGVSDFDVREWRNSAGGSLWVCA